MVAIYNDEFSKTCTILATDLEVFYRGKVMSRGTTTSFCIDPTLLLKVLPKMNGDINLEYIGDSKVHIWSGNKSIEVGMLGIDEFPVFPTSLREEYFVTVPLKNFLEQINKTFHAVSRDDIRPLLTGVLFDRNLMAATNGFELSTIPLGVSLSERKFVIPFTSLKKFKLLDKDFDFLLKSKSDVNSTYDTFFADDGTNSIVGDCISGDFPNYIVIIPSNPDDPERTKVVLNTKEVKDALEFLMPFTKGSSETVRINKGVMSVNTEDSQEVSVTVTNLQAAPEFALNGWILLDVLKEQLLDGVFTLNMKTTSMPIIFNNCNPNDGLALIMPIRIGK